MVPGEVGRLLIHAPFLSNQFSKARVACEVNKHNADRKISGYTPCTSAYRALNHWGGVNGTGLSWIWVNDGFRIRVGLGLAMVSGLGLGLKLGLILGL